MIKLAELNRDTIILPEYDRETTQAGIVHLGVGAFHRAHQAVYTERVLNQFGGDWRITGVSLRSAGTRDSLRENDYLYTVEVRDRERSSHQVIGALKNILVAPENPSAVIEALANTATSVVTLTITEKGYGLHPDSGQLNIGDPDIANDLSNPEQPKSALGYLAAGLERRMQAGRSGLTLISCDNLASNGKNLKRALLTFCGHLSTELQTWVETHCRFPCTMVDRIVPATTKADIQQLEQHLGYDDQGAVFTEPFSQWIIEKDFAGPVPAWDKVGAEFVDDVEPFEEMKLRLLNASHSTMAYIGSVAGLETVADAIAQPAIRQALQRLMKNEAEPSLRLPADFDLAAYQMQLIERFGNSALKHRCQQIAMDGSQKIPQRLMPLLMRDGEKAIATFAIAAWIRYLRGTDEAERSYTVHDNLAETLQQAISTLPNDSARQVHAINKIKGLFPAAVGGNEALIAMIQGHLAEIDKQGVLPALGSLLGSAKA